MKKILAILAAVMLSLFAFTGCTTSKSFTFTVETGDKIEVELDTTDGYDISSDIPFTISKDGETLLQGTFIYGSYCEKYVEAANTDPLAEIIDTGTKGEAEYVFYSYDDSEYNYIVSVKGSNTGILLGSQVSKEAAEECFNLLTITLAE